MHLGYLLRVYKLPPYFRLSMPFSDNGLISWVILFVLFFFLHHQRESSKKCHYICHYKSQRKNNIDWRPRGLWLTYRGRFISAASSWRTQTPACCPVCGKKIMAFLSIWKTYLVSLECWIILHCEGKWLILLVEKGLVLLYQLLHFSHKSYWTDRTIYTVQSHIIIV